MLGQPRRAHQRFVVRVTHRREPPCHSIVIVLISEIRRLYEEWIGYPTVSGALLAGTESLTIARNPILEERHETERSQYSSGKILAVTKGSTTAHVILELAPGLTITSSITNEAVDDLGLKVGDAVSAVIKAPDVIIGK